MYAIAQSLALLEGSTPDDEASRKRLGAYLMMTMVIVNTITSAMFTTAMAGNPIAVEAAAALADPVEISWGRWALAAVVPGLVSLAAAPWLLFRLFPPDLKATPNAPGTPLRS